MWRWLKRLLFLLALVPMLLIAAVVLTLRPGDRALWPPRDDGRIAIFVVSHGYHAGVVIPLTGARAAAMNGGLASMVAVSTRFAAFPWIEIGWGDEQFYRHAPNAASVTAGLALRALLLPGNPSVLHVVGVTPDARTAFPAADIVRVALSTAGFGRLLARVDATFTRRNSVPEELGDGIYGPSLFYRGNGDFHLFNVCNHWIADLLDAAGVPTSRMLATHPAGLLLDLKWRAGLVPLPRRPRPTAQTDGSETWILPVRSAMAIPPPW